MATETSHLYSSGPPRVLSNLLRFVVELASIELFPLYPTLGKTLTNLLVLGGPVPITWPARLTEVFCHAD